jgi:hypothetical protein
MKTATVRLLDGSATGLSSLCLIHCLALPVMTALLPALGAWAQAEWVHVVFVAFAAPIAGLALVRPVCGRAPPAGMLALGGLGVLGLAVGAFGPQVMETPVTVAGSGCLATAHIWNWRRQSGAHRPAAG